MPQTTTLASLREGESGSVTTVDLPPTTARRLADLGLTRGTRVSCAFKSPAGDPCAYLIRGALIALRQSDAAGVALEDIHHSSSGPHRPWASL